MKIFVVFGTRPEAIKMIPVILEIKKQGLSVVICNTAQHRQMLDQVLNFFDIVPDYDLDLMQPNQHLNQLSARLLERLDTILQNEQPDVVLVHGDTTTSSISAMVAFHKGIKVAHIEAGLRTYNMESPFPEEVNRQITARLAHFHFAPTTKAKSNLLNEKIPEEKIVVTGNTIVDALDLAKDIVSKSKMNKEILSLESKLNLDKRLILVTGHRRESFAQGLASICEALIELSQFDNINIVYPVHFNPHVQETVYNLLKEQPNIYLINPVSYPTMLWLLDKAAFIISDSGGIQEEAPSFNKKILVTRNHSERLEGLDQGFSKLVGTNKKTILKEAIKLLTNPENLDILKNPYGDGKAAGRIINHIRKNLNPKV
ncbi:UDP-N-acetylglucosamine 2-epimerase (non-hydrolyzing) [uncultured Christiangramia sp.]|uniref:non-hydrolyzing UDP-N-acetylglucosamine 2-epimerase n=1 Tax=Christiangramia sp. 3-2217-3z TaxID=3417564 RepID=UPI00345B2D31